MNQNIHISKQTLGNRTVKIKPDTDDWFEKDTVIAQIKILTKAKKYTESMIKL